MNSATQDLYFKSKRISLILLGATAVICSRLLFFSFNDPEGPNFLIVFILALFIYCLSTVVYRFGPSKFKGLTRLSGVMVIQLVAIVVLYFCMK
jgi:hypothetical protein